MMQMEKESMAEIGNTTLKTDLVSYYGKANPIAIPYVNLPHNYDHFNQIKDATKFFELVAFSCYLPPRSVKENDRIYAKATGVHGILDGTSAWTQGDTILDMPLYVCKPTKLEDGSLLVNIDSFPIPFELTGKDISIKFYTADELTILSPLTFEKPYYLVLKAITPISLTKK